MPTHFLTFDVLFIPGYMQPGSPAPPRDNPFGPNFPCLHPMRSLFPSFPGGCLTLITPFPLLPPNGALLTIPAPGPFKLTFLSEKVPSFFIFTQPNRSRYSPRFLATSKGFPPPILSRTVCYFSPINTSGKAVLFPAILSYSNGLRRVVSNH